METYWILLMFLFMFIFHCLRFIQRLVLWHKKMCTVTELYFNNVSCLFLMRVLNKRGKQRLDVCKYVASLIVVLLYNYNRTDHFTSAVLTAQHKTHTQLNKRAREKTINLIIVIRKRKHIVVCRVQHNSLNLTTNSKT